MRKAAVASMQLNRCPRKKYSMSEGASIMATVKLLL